MAFDWLVGGAGRDAKIDSLNIIHVAGTKGKGSTCAFVESFLRIYGEKTGFPRKTGLYTSPHLIETNERIRINFNPLPKDVFAQNVFEVRDGLSLQQPDGPGPRYLQLLALISYHTFLKEQVDVAIYETHHGGQYDATNVILHPVVTALTSIGMDHVRELGPSIENIAWHKAGIFKASAPAFSLPREAEDRAAEKGVVLRFVRVDRNLPGNLNIQTQLSYASLAREISNAFLELKHPGVSPCLTIRDIAHGVQRFPWLGRFQVVPEGKYSWYLDGAHNELSIGEAAVWFQQVSRQRDGLGVLKRLSETLNLSIQHAIFTTYSYQAIRPMLEGMVPRTEAWNEPTPWQAVARARELGKGKDAVHILVTGSLHLVGSALRQLGDVLQP
ncbi:folylpolyglutamate synthase [Diplogelasinospora grovesii]|uniref:tetrahydrofolate synthase n=1 Tax=Diplogelasinospora grovesii TaxID=303347 RepID=A0AAN6S3A8_9PEZI|nr:folylpolyglutamate synthase [Diplogelasinospora grovesii]